MQSSVSVFRLKNLTLCFDWFKFRNKNEPTSISNGDVVYFFQDR
jgi:hypothetical protein